jgi:hypothetical protein
VFAAMPRRDINLNAQFQLIRHGADYGDSMVYGSSYVSELKEKERSEYPALRKYFLHDGAYQWMYIAKSRVKWNLPVKLPVSLFGEAGAVFSSFTDIETGKAKGGKKHQTSIIDTPQYPKSTGIIVNIGCKVSLR